MNMSSKPPVTGADLFRDSLNESQPINPASVVGRTVAAQAAVRPTEPAHVQLTKQQLEARLLKVLAASNGHIDNSQETLIQVVEEVGNQVISSVDQLLQNNTKLMQQAIALLVADLQNSPELSEAAPPPPVPNRYWARKAARTDPDSFWWELFQCLDALNNPDVGQGWTAIVVGFSLFLSTTFYGVLHVAERMDAPAPQVETSQRE